MYLLPGANYYVLKSSKSGEGKEEERFPRNRGGPEKALPVIEFSSSNAQTVDN
jgi:hypothetical protein